MRTAARPKSLNTRKLGPIYSLGKVEVSRLLQWGRRELRDLGEEEARASAERLLEEILQINRSAVYLDLAKEVTQDQAKEFSRLVILRKERMPLAYLVKRAYFRDEVVEVGPGCLIPRPETELLIENFLKEDQDVLTRDFEFLDLGTGSGALGISLLRVLPRARGTLSDISPEALEYAESNLKRYKLEERSRIILSDLFECFKRQKAVPKWDAIFCNAPYLSAKDLREAQPEICFEPRVALDGGEDGLDFYRRLFRECANFLKCHGALILEIGSTQRERLTLMIRELNLFSSVHSYQDLAGLDRVIIAR
ncbi:MAG: peptide chain release factor N(5)-glutamine methyltransferase [Candidatus Omnitrophica bacterium]|nr:peptide chain release factor N(5)-glutamine methyltransferase [Candidatus Omnitrophota bacterium]